MMLTRWIFALVVLVLAGPVAAEQPDNTALRGWIAEMKASPRGPFARIRWFCKDGTMLPPTPYACEPHGGGSQHGEWTDRVKQLRQQRGDHGAVHRGLHSQ